MKKAAELLKQIEPLIDGEQEKALFAKILEQRKAYSASRDGAVKAKADGNGEEAARLLEQGFTPAAKLYQELLQELVVMQRTSLTNASIQQTHGIEQVNGAIGQMDQVTQQNAALVEESAAAAASMQTQAGQLAQVVGVFKLAASVAPLSFRIVDSLYTSQVYSCPAHGKSLKFKHLRCWRATCFVSTTNNQELKMNLKSCVAMLGLCLLPLCSQAGVLYEWRALNNETPRSITLQLEFDDSIVSSGAYSFVLEDGYPSEPSPASGGFSLRYSFPGADSSQWMTYSSADGFGNGLGWLDIDVIFEKDGFLSGRIYANNTEHHFNMGSAGRTFTVIDANSDAGMPGAGCTWEPDAECGGATGQIRRAEIPEPGSLALLGAGLLAAAGLRRKAAR